MRELRVGDLVNNIYSKKRGHISKILSAPSVDMYMINYILHYAEELELVYEDIHAPMSFHKTNDSVKGTKQEAMASNDTIEAIEKMME